MGRAGSGVGTGLGSKLALWRANLLRTIGGAGAKQARPAALLVTGKTNYHTLGKALTWEVMRPIPPEGEGEVWVGVAHYWARFVHDGRGQSPRNPDSSDIPRMLVWYKDPSLDPRFRTRPWPIQRSDWRHLTVDEFTSAKKADLLVIVATAYGVPGKPFLTTGLKTFPRRINTVVRKSFLEFLRKHVVIHDTQSLTLKL